MNSERRPVRPRLRAAMLLAMALSLAACTSAADRRTLDEARCRSYGFRLGTEAFAKCLLDLDLSRDADRRALVNQPYAGFGYGYGFGPRRFWW